MSRLRRCQRGSDGFVVAHFADDDYVRILPQNMDERAVERTHVGQHFLLHDDGALVLVDEFDGVFNRDDFTAAFAVNQVNEIVERRRFARAGRAGYQDEAIWFARQLVNLPWQSKLLASGDAVAAKAETHFGMSVAPVKSHADAPGGAVQ